MKKLICILLAVILAAALCACGGCDHEFAPATCDTPATCIKCGATDGEPNGHDWTEATCDCPRTCRVCGATEGEAKGHEWAEATCESPKTCKVCGATEGEAKGHDWLEATCQSPSVCSVCGAQKDSVLGEHACDEWDEYVAPSCKAEGYGKGVCKYCGEKFKCVFEKTDHSFGEWEIKKEATCQKEGQRTRKCTVCNLKETEAVPVRAHNPGGWTEYVTPQYGRDGSYARLCTECGTPVEEKPYTYAERIKGLYSLSGVTDGAEVTDVYLYEHELWFAYQIEGFVEITNIGNTNIMLKDCDFEYHDVNGKYIGGVTDRGYGLSYAPDIIKPGEKGYFVFWDWREYTDIDLSNGLVPYAKVKLEMTFNEPNRLKIEEASWQAVIPTVTATIRNNTGKFVDSVVGIAVFRDEYGRVVNIARDLKNADLDPGESRMINFDSVWRTQHRTRDLIRDYDVMVYEFVIWD